MDYQNHAKSVNKKTFNQQKIFQNCQRPQNYNKHSSSNSFVADKNEFPSLSEISEPDRSPLKNPLFSIKTHLTYSDKLKVSVPKEKHQVASVQFIDRGHNSNRGSSNVQRQQLNAGRNQSDKTSSNNPLRTNTANAIDGKIRHKSSNSSVQQILKFDPSHLRSSEFSADIISKKNGGLDNITASSKSPKSKNKPKDERHSNDTYDKGNAEEFGNEHLPKTTKKKKRKSKVKRLVELQSGKIIVLTPEAHTKILNQSHAQNSQVPKHIVSDINNSEEYPELGKTPVSKIIEQKILKPAEIDPKRSELSPYFENKDTDKNANCLNDPHSSLVSNEMKESVQSSSKVGEKSKNGKEIKIEPKTTVHKKDPITVSFIDILSTTMAKAKEPKEKLDLRISAAPDKIKKGQPHNLLDSKPAIKRGKERENPRTKRPSHLKRIILLDRQTRKEKLNQCLNHTLENKKAENDNTLETDENGMTNINFKTLPIDQFSESSILENIKQSSSLPLESLETEKENTTLCNHVIILESTVTDSKTVSTLDENNDASFFDIEQLDKEELDEMKVDKSYELPMHEVCDSYNLDIISLPELKSIKHYIASENIIEAENVSKSRISVQPQKIVNGASVNKSCIEVSLSDKNVKLDITESIHNSDYMPVQSIANSNKQELISPAFTIASSPSVIHFSEEQKLEAAKIVIHTRSFREYCTHLTSKDIDDTVTALIDDLVRFQDRMHQKDPVKAKMKRRLIFGIKEVKKHLKLRKLKCIIIATDIENVQAEGGLNDVLNEMKSSAEDHHTPFIFSLPRKRLGKQCHKPVPVSCIGVFNYDGSEANFKKMIELREQSTKDYTEILNNLVEQLSDDSMRQLFKVRNEAPEVLYNLRTDILRKFLLPDRTNKNEEFIDPETA